jgi:hypothetical protein
MTSLDPQRQDVQLPGRVPIEVNSQHLKILKDAALVEDTAAGTRRSSVLFRCSPAGSGTSSRPSTTCSGRRSPRFFAESPTRTRVELEHRHIDRHGPGWEAITDGVDGPEGWPLYLDRYATLMKQGR